MSSRSSDQRCPNCGSELKRRFCAECGQRQLDLDRPFLELVAQGLATFLAFDTRLARTLWPLIARPGLLTVEFLAGRRARYVHPFKLYFAFSLLFFFGFSLSSYSIVQVDEPGVVIINTGAEERPAPWARGVAADAGGDGSSDHGGEAWLTEFFEPLDEIAENDPERLNRLFIDRLSTSMIVLVPIFAMLLQLLYWKPRYVTHLVFALHLHGFSFLVLVVGALVDGLIGLFGGNESTTGNNLATLAVVIYAFLALRRVYGQGLPATLGKLLLLMLGYAVALVMTMVGTFVATVAAL